MRGLSRMIPITLITGFLGVGKTTLLQRIVAYGKDRRLVFLVNDFARVDVDGELVRSAGADVVSIAGGSIFCRCLVTDFIRYLKMVAEELNTLEQPVEGVVIEASGIADPRVIKDMLSETALDSHFLLASVISVVDPGSFRKLIHTLPNIRAQIESASVVLVNKSDCYPAEELEQTVQQVREINPNATVETTVECETEIDLFDISATAEFHGDYAKCRDPNYETFCTTCDTAMDVPKLEAAIGELGAALYRAKGHVLTAEGAHYLDYSASGLTLNPVSANPPYELIWIVKGPMLEHARATVSKLIA